MNKIKLTKFIKDNATVILIVLIVGLIIYSSNTSSPQLQSILNPQNPSDWGVFKIAANLYAPSVIPSTDAEWINKNLAVVMTHESLVDDLSGKTPNSKVLMYKTAGWNADTETVSVCCYPSLQASHEDWFLHNSGGRIRDPNTPHISYWMNYKSQGWMTHSIQDITSDFNTNSNVAGLFYDAIQVEKGEQDNPNEYSSNTDLRNSLFNLLTQFNSIPGELWINAAPYSTGYDDYPGGAEALGKKFMDLSDGFFDESFGLRWQSAGWYPSDILEIQLRLMDYAITSDTDYIANILFKYYPDKTQDVLALYLIGVNQHTFVGIYYNGYNLQSYKDFINNNQDLIKKIRWLGQPTSSRSKSGTIYTRNFDNGQVTFNLATNIGTITTNTPVPQCIATSDCQYGFTCVNNICSEEPGEQVCSYPSSIPCNTQAEVNMIQQDFYEGICSATQLSSCQTHYQSTLIVCGNNIKEQGEVCDGSDLNGRECIDFNYDAGSLLCKNDCSGYIYTSCTVEQPECVLNSDCGTGRLCVSNVCIVDTTECYVNTDCVANQTCQNNVCVDNEPIDGICNVEGFPQKYIIDWFKVNNCDTATMVGWSALIALVGGLFLILASGRRR